MLDKERLDAAEWSSDTCRLVRIELSRNDCASPQSACRAAERGNQWPMIAGPVAVRKIVRPDDNTGFPIPSFGSVGDKYEIRD